MLYHIEWEAKTIDPSPKNWMKMKDDTGELSDLSKILIRLSEAESSGTARNVIVSTVPLDEVDYNLTKVTELDLLA